MDPVSKSVSVLSNIDEVAQQKRRHTSPSAHPRSRECRNSAYQSTHRWFHCQSRRSWSILVLRERINLVEIWAHFVRNFDATVHCNNLLPVVQISLSLIFRNRKNLKRLYSYHDLIVWTKNEVNLFTKFIVKWSSQNSPLMIH